MSQRDLRPVQQALIDAGIEIYGLDEAQAEIHVAERIRLHIMDAGVRVRVADTLHVEFTGRSQRSDFPTESPDDLFARVRTVIGQDAFARGYVETQALTVEVKDPVDASRILDVWHEITFRKATASIEQTIEEVQWALQVEKYVGNG